MTYSSAIGIEGIKFYSVRSECIYNHKNKHWIEKAISLIASFGTLLAYAINKVLMTFQGVEKQMETYTLPPSSQSSNKKLIVCLHGLNNNPTQFKKIVDEMHQLKNFNADLYIPKIIQRGNAKLDEMVAPILQNIAEWARTGKDKELVLVGISNGGRIAKAIEAELINTKKIGMIKRLRFVSIVGANKGSSLVTLANKVHASGILSKNIAEEMPPESERFKKLNDDFERASKFRGLTRKYTFIASPHDWQVPDYKSSLMNIQLSSTAEARYAIVPNHGHNSIVNAVAKSVASIVLAK